MLIENKTKKMPKKVVDIKNQRQREKEIIKLMSLVIKQFTKGMINKEEMIQRLSDIANITKNAKW